MNQPSEESAQGRWRRLKLLLQVLFLVAIGIFIVIYLQDQWDRIEQRAVDVNWGLLLAAQIMLSGTWLLLPYGPLMILRFMNAPMPPLSVWRIFFLASAAKYLPGGIWSMPSQVFLYQRGGLDTGRSVVAVFWEFIMKLSSAAVVSLLSIPFVLMFVPLEVLLGILLVIALFVSLLVYFVLRGERLMRLMERLPDAVVRSFLVAEDRLTLSQIGRLAALYVVIWLLAGLAFSGVVFAVSGDFRLGWGLPLTGLFILAWLVGFIVVITPGGLGVRDGIIILGTSLLFNEPLPAVIAIVMRIVWTLAEVSGLIISLIAYALFARKQWQETEHTPG